MAVEKETQVMDSSKDAREFSVLPTLLKNGEQHACFSAAARSGHPRLFRDETNGACEGHRLRPDEELRRIAFGRRGAHDLRLAKHELRR